MKIERGARDYGRIRYYMDAMEHIWHGPFCRHANVHWKTVDSLSVACSELPREAVEITPYQAAQEIERIQEILR